MSESESSLQPKGAFRFAPWSVVLGVVGAICVTIWLMRPGELPSPLGNDPPIKKAEGRAPTDGVLEAPVEKRTDSLPSEDESQEPTVPREPELVLPKPTPSAHAPAVPHPLVLPAEPPIAARVDTGVPASVLDDELLPSPEKIAALKAEELATARELVAEFPDEVHAIIVLGNVYTRHGSTREAVRCWQRCAELAPDRVDAHIGLGDVAQRKGDFRQAAESWRRVIKMNPQTPGIHGKLAGALMNLGETQEALVHFQRDVELSPQAAKSHFLLGQARFQMKQYREAKQSYLRATEIWPEFWNAYYSLARVSAKLGEKEEAKKYQAKFKELKALELDDLIDRSTSFDDLVAVRKGVAKTLNSAARVHRSHDDSPRAVALWQRAVALDSQDVVSRQALATLFQTTDRLSEALRLHRELTILQPDNPTHFLDMGVVGVRLKQLDQAKTAFAQAIELAPDKADGYGMLASVYLMRNEQLPEAKRLATKAVSLEPSARNYFLYSQSLDKTGDRPGAVAAAKRAVELDPTNAKYRRVYSYLVTHN